MFPALLSEESETFHKCSADFIKEVQDPKLLAQELHTGNVISKNQVDEVSKVGLSDVQRKTRLFGIVGDRIAVDLAKFQSLLKVLRKQPPLENIVDKLEATYRSHLEVGNKGRGMKGLSQCNVKYSISVITHNMWNMTCHQRFDLAFIPSALMEGTMAVLPGCLS